MNRNAIGGGRRSKRARTPELLTPQLIASQSTAMAAAVTVVRVAVGGDSPRRRAAIHLNHTNAAAIATATTMKAADRNDEASGGGYTHPLYTTAGLAWRNSCNNQAAEEKMRLSGLFIPIVCGVALTATACGRAEERKATQEAALATRAQTTGKEVTVTGCLTSAPDRGAFVVTADRNALASGALQSGSGEVPTYTYELVNASGDLTPHVGRQVEVKGHLDPDRDDEVDVDTKDKTKEPPTRVGGDTVTPAVETRSEIEIQVRRLHVVSTTPTGQPCSK
jgi:hypothetical protein